MYTIKKGANAMQEQKISKKDYEALLEIAKEAFYSIEQRGDLETRHSDHEDFLDISVWGLKEVLIQAFEYGKKMN
ncbi:hypothetical protein [Acetobacterium sp. KB-1]|jgi:hypothetical protein|uniref:DUF6900 domain-containing protein n=1 Tax=Acetobacterium sp. KB-1 TaxID=2184575 RepID=UPI000DBEAB4A|nr:hypothetical protein [Acetobacterium sp. KB-1]AWW25960.1 hypothetical protein DOZ58_04430 [Acetobacterium sp. KB-1]